MILSICDTPKVLEVMNIVNIIITIIRIVVPIILLFSLTFKLVNASTKGDEDALASIKKKAVPSIIAAALIFIVPVLVNLIVSVSFPNSEYTKCIANISSEKIETIYTDKEDKLVGKAEETLNINDYINAKNYLTNIKDNSKRESYESRLEEVKIQIDAIREEMFLGSYDKVNYSNFKWTYYKATSGPLNNYTDKTINHYAIWAPENVGDLNGVSLPLIIWLHGSGELAQNGVGEKSLLGSGLLKVMTNWDKYNLKPVPAIIVAPHTNLYWGRQPNYETMKAAIRYCEDTYNIDNTKIVLMGHSMGGNGTVDLSYTYRDLNFYAAVPMSTQITSYHGEEGRKYYSNLRMRGYGEFSSFADFFKWIGQSENYTYYKGESHAKVPERAMTEDLNGNGVSDLVEWLFYE